MKLDKSFVDDYADEKGSCIIQCVLDLAKQLKIPVVAEGVETEEQYHYLKNSGCDVIQGYYFSKPISKEDYYQKYYA
jgi:EAL domain-containing protein (putative c-di-GMP-specific phosphodiesterase class I)